MPRHSPSVDQGITPAIALRGHALHARSKRIAAGRTRASARLVWLRPRGRGWRIFRSTKQFKHCGNQSFKGSGSMTDMPFYCRREFAESLMIFWHPEEWIVPEPIRTSKVLKNSAATSAFNGETNPPSRIGQYGMTNVEG